MFDAEVAYTVRDALTFVLGAQNLFDEYPEENPGARGRRRQSLQPVHAVRIQRRVLVRQVHLQLRVGRRVRLRGYVPRSLTDRHVTQPSSFSYSLMSTRIGS